MPYTQNPHLPKVRARAAWLVRVDGWSIRQTARYIGVEPSTISRWVNRAPLDGRVHAIPTLSSRPHHSPRAVSTAIVERIVTIRQERHRCAEVIHAQLRREGWEVSLTTVKRTLIRQHLIRPRSPWKQWHQSGERPSAHTPGALVEMDSVHLWVDTHRRTYLVTVLDCYSRWAHARAFPTLTTVTALRTAREALTLAPFPFTCIQSDHGPEFTTYFSTMIAARGIRHRHSRVRQPNDNAHIERFNRTIQEDLQTELRHYRTNIPKLNHILKDYLHYYNTERLHLGLNLATPLEVLQRS